MKIKKVNEMVENKDTWKDVFCRQVDTGKFWKNLFKDDFEKHQFLDRSDAVHVCKKAQSDAYENVINKLEGKVDDSVLTELKEMLEQHWKDASEDSALGMFQQGKQIK